MGSAEASPTSVKEMRSVLAGTGYENRAAVIRRFCRKGSALELRREPENVHDSNAIGVWLRCPILFGLWRPWYMIGYLPASRAATWAARIDQKKVQIIDVTVVNFHAPNWKEHPDVTALVRYLNQSVI